MKRILKYIAEAQLHSDAGKGIYDLEEYMQKEGIGYAYKDKCIIRAIHLINTKKNSGVYYNVKRDSSHIAYFIVYFNYKIDGKRRQISFHSFDMNLEKFISKSCSTRWDKKNSRANAKEIAEVML